MTRLCFTFEDTVIEQALGEIGRSQLARRGTAYVLQANFKIEHNGIEAAASSLETKVIPQEAGQAVFGENFVLPESFLRAALDTLRSGAMQESHVLEVSFEAIPDGISCEMRDVFVGVVPKPTESVILL